MGRELRIKQTGFRLEVQGFKKKKIDMSKDVNFNIKVISIR